MCIKSLSHGHPSYLHLLLLLLLHQVSTMENDDVLPKFLVSLAAISVFTGLYTQSLYKMGATYLLGMFLICCFTLPRWPFFNRPISQWRTLDHQYAANQSQSRFKLYPARVLIYTTVYSFAFYQWWNFVNG